MMTHFRLFTATLTILFLSMVAVAAETTNLDSVKGLSPGDVIVLHGYTDSGKDLELKIKAHHILKGSGYESHIFDCSSDETIYIDLEKDKVIVSVVEKDVDLNAVGLSENKLDKIDAKEKGSISYDGKEFNYFDSDEAAYYENGEEDEKVYYWEFDTTDGDYTLQVIYFDEEEEYVVELLEELDLNEISIKRSAG